MSPMSTDLTQSVERLYAVFGKYGLHAPVKGCDHCVMPEDIARIQAKPLRELDAEDLRKYAFKALTTWGEEEDFKHFLPRLFELAADELLYDGGDLMIETLFDKLHYTHWKNWPANERQAFAEFLHAMWARALTLECDAGQVLCCIAQTEIELTGFLDHWLYRSGNAGIRKLVEFGNDKLGDLTKYRVIKDAYWDDHNAQVAEVSQWLLAEPTLKHLEEHSVANAGEVGSEQAMDLAGYLRALRT